MTASAAVEVVPGTVARKSSGGVRDVRRPFLIYHRVGPRDGEIEEEKMKLFLKIKKYVYVYMQ